MTTERLCSMLDLTEVAVDQKTIDLLSAIADLGYVVVTAVRYPGCVIVTSGRITSVDSTAQGALAGLYEKLVEESCG